MLAELLYSFRDIVVGPNLDERRTTARVRCSIPISCLTKQAALVCTLKDLSSTGARIFSDQKARKNTIVQLSPPKGMGGNSGPMKGKVAWVRPSQGGYLMGLKFQSGPTGWVSTVLREMGLSTSPPTQQRKHVRVPGEMNVKLQTQGFDKTVLLRDLSIGGALLTAKDQVADDQTVRLTIPAEADLPELVILSVACGCKKAHSGSGFDVSIRFPELSVKQKKILVKHLSYLIRRSMSY